MQLDCLTYPQSACGHVGDVMQRRQLRNGILVLLQLPPKFGGPSFFLPAAPTLCPRGGERRLPCMETIVKVTLSAVFAAHTERDSMSFLAIVPAQLIPFHPTLPIPPKRHADALPQSIPPPITITKQTADTKTRSPNQGHYSHPPSSHRHEPPQTSPSDLPRPLSSLAQSAVIL